MSENIKQKVLEYETNVHNYDDDVNILEKRILDLNLEIVNSKFEKHKLEKERMLNDIAKILDVDVVELIESSKKK